MKPSVIPPIKLTPFMDKNCKEYNDGEFKYLFDAAATDMMCAEDVVAYSQSLQRLNDIDLEIQYAKDKSFEEGTSKGLARGRAEGRATLLLGIGMSAGDTRERWHGSLVRENVSFVADRVVV